MKRFASFFMELAKIFATFVVATGVAIYTVDSIEWNFWIMSSFQICIVVMFISLIGSFICVNLDK